MRWWAVRCWSKVARTLRRLFYDRAVDVPPAEKPRDEIGDFTLDWGPKLQGTGDVRLGMQQYFAADHIRSAKLMADKCRHREDECVNDNPPVLDFEIRSYALAAIMESAAFLEAVVNEFIQQVAYFADENPRLAGLDAGTVDRLRREQIDSDPIAKLRLLEKYDLTLSCAGKNPINKGASPGQDVVALIHARNALEYYKTEMHWDDTEHKIEKQVRHLVRSNPLMTKGTRPWFPHHLLCANVAEWAWKKSVELEQIWQRSLGVAFNASSQPIRCVAKDADDKPVVLVLRPRAGGPFDVLGTC